MDIEQEKIKLFSELKELREFIEKIDIDIDLIQNLERQNGFTAEKIQKCNDEQDIIFVRQRIKKLGSWLRYNFDSKEDKQDSAEQLPRGEQY